MKNLIILSLVAIAFSLPYSDKISLANSLIVGREDLQDLYDWECKVCSNENKPIHAHSVEEKAVDIKCIISVYDNFVILAFRYTNTALNVWQDILYPLQIVDEHTCSKCKVQKAYNNMWEQIKEDVFDDLRKTRQQTKIQTLHITGISLGGGLAVISFVDISYQKIFPIVNITTFGAPRVGNKDWANFFEQATNYSTRRYYVEKDPIVSMPTCLTILCNYKQTGIPIVCKEGSQACYMDEEQSYSYYWKAGKYLIEHGLNSIVDHIDGYPKIYNFTLIQK